MRYSITIIIPTYDRPQHIDDILLRQINNYRGDLFRFAIYDSSKEKESLLKYEALAQALKPSIKIDYNYCPNIYSLSAKVEYAIRKVDTEYIYLVGDGINVNYDNLEKELLNMNFSKYDVININPASGYYCKKNRCKKSNHEYGSNSRQFVIDNMSLMTLYGASIVKTQLMIDTIKCNYYQHFFELNDGNGFVYVSSLCEKILELKNLELISCISESIKWSKIVKPRSNIWCVGSSLYEVGFKRFLNSIDGMKNLSKAEKDIIIHRYYFDDWSAYRVLNLLNLRAENSITKDLIDKYKKYLIQSGLYRRFLLVSFIPVFPLALCKKILRLVKRIVKGCLRKNGYKK